ncbi:MAG: thioredoxin-dependent thiol peroxidase [Verrucomicrobia bacterium]|nr:MAG: thioredoxin-dependent thiol peroxidase [Verrucomicrobiota bacterium]
MAKEVKLALKPGDPAPAFSATATDGTTISLEGLAGRDVILYFYPRDDTPGCTKEACAFRDGHAKFQAKGAVVLGVSPDTVKAHAKFTEKFRLPFPLLADESKSISQAYGAWGEKTFMGRKYLGVHRVTFHIGKDGRIAHVWATVKPEEHAAEVLAALG